MQCRIPICQKEIQGEGHTHGLGDGQHTIAICDECEEKLKNFRPDYEDDGQDKQFFWVWRKIVYADFIDTATCPQCQQDAHLVDMWYGERRRIVCTGCGLHYDTAFLKPVYLHETEISDGKGGKAKVRQGDLVALLPYDPEKPKGEEGRNVSFLEDFYRRRWQSYSGEGPYPISRIGLWPCGRVMLYLKTRDSSGSGVTPNEFMVASQ